jgi:hypothetical protein
MVAKVVHALEVAPPVTIQANVCRNGATVARDQSFAAMVVKQVHAVETAGTVMVVIVAVAGAP